MRFFDEMQEELTYEETEKSPLNREVVSKLINYLEKRFPSYNDMSDAINVELRNYIKVEDGKPVASAKKKIMKILKDEKDKYLERVKSKAEKLQVITKVKKQKPVEPERESDG